MENKRIEEFRKKIIDNEKLFDLMGVANAHP
jgi:hypothetical protein